ncbi:hypothetical protein [Pseudoalteromonas sp. MMG012]|uniref:hypothetical protein n=1 Tax=Pseudoalteromonas sp. MMG012 TaxID=2822686 RepID=UPI001B3A126E|nr:hypothetical protein [Pseudoalteromonas sp. MMG012]MBQ4851465.1 hypothetical protein [Pseudoalteromonas sp. MMG012]
MFYKQTYVQSTDDILFNLKAPLCSNSGLLQMKATPRVRKIALLGKFAYPELRLSTLISILGIYKSTLGAVDLSGSFLQQFDWILYQAEAA